MTESPSTGSGGQSSVFCPDGLPVYREILCPHNTVIQSSRLSIHIFQHGPQRIILRGSVRYPARTPACPTARSYLPADRSMLVQLLPNSSLVGKRPEGGGFQCSGNSCPLGPGGGRFVYSLLASDLFRSRRAREKAFWMEGRKRRLISTLGPEEP